MIASHVLFHEQKDSPEEEVRIKILQTLPLLVKPASYSATPLFVSQAFEVSFKMLADKSAIIQNTAEATVRQVTGATDCAANDRQWLHACFSVLAACCTVVRTT